MSTSVSTIAILGVIAAVLFVGGVLTTGIFLLVLTRRSRRDRVHTEGGETPDTKNPYEPTRLQNQAYPSSAEQNAPVGRDALLPVVAILLLVVGSLLVVLLAALFFFLMPISAR